MNYEGTATEILRSVGLTEEQAEKIGRLLELPNNNPQVKLVRVSSVEYNSTSNTDTIGKTEREATVKLTVFLSEELNRQDVSELCFRTVNGEYDGTVLMSKNMSGNGLSHGFGYIDVNVLRPSEHVY